MQQFDRVGMNTRKAPQHGMQQIEKNSFRFVFPQVTTHTRTVASDDII